MNTDSWSFDQGYLKIKTARQKRRLLLEDRDKQLIKIHKRREELWKQLNALQPVLLDEPYQKGWVRYFVLRQDVAASPQAEFYRCLLEKINTNMYHHDRKYRRRVKKNRKNIWEDIPQSLREFRLWEWAEVSAKMTEKEKELFYPFEYYVVTAHRIEKLTKMIFTEHWRYVLRVRPNMITHRKGFDETLESQVQEVENYIDRNGLYGKMSRLLHGSRWRMRSMKDEPRFISPLKNVPLHRIIAEAKEDYYQQPAATDWLLPFYDLLLVRLKVNSRIWPGGYFPLTLIR